MQKLLEELQIPLHEDFSYALTDEELQNVFQFILKSNITAALCGAKRSTPLPYQTSKDI